MLLLVSTCTPTAVAEFAPERSSSKSVHHAELARLTPERAVDHVVIVTIDGVRWQEVLSGVDPVIDGSRSTKRFPTAEALMPELHRIARSRGVLLGHDGSKVSVSSPSTVSLPGYSELFGGRAPSCANNDCGPTQRATFLDAWQQAQPRDALAVISSWERIPLVAARDPSGLIVSAGRRQWQNFDGPLGDSRTRAVLDAGREACPVPGVGDYRPDRYTTEVALRVVSQRSPEFLFLGLGDTDEYAHQGDYAAYLESLHEADRVIGLLDAWLALREDLGKRTLLVVTTDHGRARTFRHHGGAKEAARIWMLWGGSVIHTRGYPSAADLRLADVVPTIEPLVGVAPRKFEREGDGLARVDLLRQPSQLTGYLRLLGAAPE